MRKIQLLIILGLLLGFFGTNPSNVLATDVWVYSEDFYGSSINY